MSVSARVARGAAGASRRAGRRRVEPVFYWFLLPTLLLFTALVLLPAVVGVFYSFTDYVGFGDWSFVGITNYRAVFSDPAVFDAYAFTIGFALVTVILAQAVALALALGLTSRIRYATALRSIFVIPMVISGIVIAYVFNYLFSNTLPSVAGSIGFGPLEESILGNPDLAWIAIVIVSAWQTIPGALLIYIAGLLSIPHELYEAAAIDGASPWRRFRSVTLPLIAGFILINTILGIKGYLNAYDIIVALTQGGPGTETRSVAMTIFTGYTGGDYAYQMANATVFFVLTVVVSLLQLLATRGRGLRL
ncbi:raffinose/stachyose/melibiose transport system permease protein [Streptomyces aurantiacus]|uniref:carbohydrate ABC transporter permease n=1 Tax=Streptomyces aurantiacus TaxID=47760 RepID=UPI0027924E4B|nr:sugar ABC transporter permease [Streptomyces aurantiacus]MDQ0772008.1 raffinose/stachyose/melibiose transport system permease protein [Streptomyces aurantiacus]